MISVPVFLVLHEVFSVVNIHSDSVKRFSKNVSAQSVLPVQKHQFVVVRFGENVLVYTFWSSVVLVQLIHN